MEPFSRMVMGFMVSSDVCVGVAVRLSKGDAASVWVGGRYLCCSRRAQTGLHVAARVVRVLADDVAVPIDIVASGGCRSWDLDSLGRYQANLRGICGWGDFGPAPLTVSYTHLRAHETGRNL